MRDSETEERISKIRRSPLSVICDRSADGVKERNPDYLLRPIFINGVEVGFAYATCDGIKKKLAVRGITISLWYFISRGHQAQALLPLCFKNFPDKSDRWDELMALYRMNLIEFTPGFGNDKYMEVNRIMARRTREHGGCMVARSQMHQIVERDPLLDKTVEMKLLMPSFNGKDLMFPIDGPLGRKGPSLTDTLKCTTDDPEWTRCGLQQLTLNDQRIWLKNLSDITLDSEWMIIASKINRYQLTKAAFVPSILEPNEAMHLELHPFQTNQGDNRGTYEMRHRAQQNDFHGRQSLIVHCILRFDNYCSRSYIRPNAQGSRVLSEEQRRYRTADRNFPDSNTYFVPSYRRNSRTLHETEEIAERNNSAPKRKKYDMAMNDEAERRNYPEMKNDANNVSMHTRICFKNDDKQKRNLYGRGNGFRNEKHKKGNFFEEGNLSKNSFKRENQFRKYDSSKTDRYLRDDFHERDFYKTQNMPKPRRLIGNDRELDHLHKEESAGVIYCKKNQRSDDDGHRKSDVSKISNLYRKQYVYNSGSQEEDILVGHLWEGDYLNIDHYEDKNATKKDQGSCSGSCEKRDFPHSNILHGENASKKNVRKKEKIGFHRQKNQGQKNELRYRDYVSADQESGWPRQNDLFRKDATNWRDADNTNKSGNAKKKYQDDPFEIDFSHMKDETDSSSSQACKRKNRTQYQDIPSYSDYLHKKPHLNENCNSGQSGNLSKGDLRNEKNCFKFKHFSNEKMLQISGSSKKNDSLLHYESSCANDSFEIDRMPFDDESMQTDEKETEYLSRNHSNESCEHHDTNRDKTGIVGDDYSGFEILHEKTNQEALLGIEFLHNKCIYEKNLSYLLEERLSNRESLIANNHLLKGKDQNNVRSFSGKNKRLRVNDHNKQGNNDRLLAWRSKNKAESKNDYLKNDDYEDILESIISGIEKLSLNCDEKDDVKTVKTESTNKMDKVDISRSKVMMHRNLSTIKEEDSPVSASDPITVTRDRAKSEVKRWADHNHKEGNSSESLAVEINTDKMSRKKSKEEEARLAAILSALEYPARRRFVVSSYRTEAQGSKLGLEDDDFEMEMEQESNTPVIWPNEDTGGSSNDYSSKMDYEQ